MATLVHGVDLVEVGRIESMLADHGERFVERCFTPTERAYAESAPKARGERYAARFALKEAVLKALGTGWSGTIQWTDVGVEREASGEPRLVLTGRAAEIAAERGVERWAISLSHTKGHAIASVVGLG